MSWVDIPIKYGHAPDLPRTNPDGWRIYNAWPMPGGIGARIKHVLATASASVTAAPNGGFEAVSSTGSKKYFVGIPQKIYEWDGAITSPVTFTDRSGTTYSASTATTWSFAQFGDLTFAVNLNNKLQYASAGAFADAASVAPKADIIIAPGPSTLPFIMLLNYDDGTNVYRDGWFASPTPNATWSAAVAAQIVNGRLLVPTGDITCAAAFRDGAVAFKKNSIFLAEYGDPDAIWTWRTVARAAGCVGKNAACSAEDVLYFVGPRGFYVFDGSYPKKLPGFVHDEWAAYYVNFVENRLEDYVFAVYDPELSMFTVHVGGPPVDNSFVRSWHFNTISSKWTSSRVIAALDVNAQPTVLIGPRHAANIMRPMKIDTSVTASIEVSAATFLTPRFGSQEDGVHLAGIWPTFKQGSRFNNNLGPNESALFSTSVVLYGYNRPHAASAQSASTAVVETSAGRAYGHVSGNWVDADFNVAMQVGPEFMWEFEAVGMDIQGSGKK